jgi:hypothetical protein
MIRFFVMAGLVPAHHRIHVSAPGDVGNPGTPRPDGLKKKTNNPARAAVYRA